MKRSLFPNSPRILVVALLFQVLLPAASLNFSIVNPDRISPAGAINTFGGTITNNTGVTLGAKDLFLNFSGYDAANVTLSQLVGSTTFTLPNGSTSGFLNLFTFTLSGAAQAGAYSAQVALQAITGDNSAGQTVSVTVSTPEPGSIALTLAGGFALLLVRLRKKCWPLLPLLAVVVIAPSLTKAQVSAVQFLTDQPGLTQMGTTVTVALPIRNGGSLDATNVLVTSAVLHTAPLVSPAVFPVSLGTIAAGGRAVFQADFDGTGLTQNTPYLLTVSGTYQVGGASAGFSVNRFITVPVVGPGRHFPDTTDGIFVFSDQFDTSNLTEAQFEFAATHYVGAQKLLPGAARRLRQDNSNFLVLHYRLGQGLGYRVPDQSCQPTGSYIQIIDGTWVNEWPGNSVVKPEWFFKYAGAPRVYNCNFGWYLMELNDPSWRAWWSNQVIQQLQTNEDDGVFADSYSIPNYGFTWNPPLPVVDSAFEQAWATREHNFTDYIRGQFNGRWKWIPNVGAYITTRDPSDYSNVDGVMIEQFAEYGNENYLALGDWQLQMNRVLSLINKNKILIAQTYPTGYDLNERMFDIGTYLLIKGKRTYVNLASWGLDVQWIPEYGVNLGPAVDSLPTDIATYWNPNWNVYVRRYKNGMVLVNPTSTNSGPIDLGAHYYRVEASGGGPVSSDGTAPGSLSYVATKSVDVCSDCAAIILYRQP